MVFWKDRADQNEEKRRFRMFVPGCPERSGSIREQVGGYLSLLFLLGCSASGWFLGDALGAWMRASNFLLMPWAGGFLGLVLGDLISRAFPLRMRAR